MVGIDSSPIAKIDREWIVALEVVEECRLLGIPCNLDLILASIGVVCANGVKRKGVAHKLYELQLYVLASLVGGNIDCCSSCVESVALYRNLIVTGINLERALAVGIECGFWILQLIIGLLYVNQLSSKRNAGIGGDLDI